MLYTGLTRFRGACRRGGRRERLLRLHGGNIDCIARTRKSVCEGRRKANGKIVEQEGKISHSGSAGALRQGGGAEKKQSEKPAETFCFSGFRLSVNLLGRSRTSGRFVGDAYMRPVRFSRWIALPVWLQRAAYMPPLQTKP